MVNEYTDKYFLRTREILEKEGLNPTAKAQVFVRKGPGVVAGMDEALDLISKYATETKVMGLKDGMTYEPGEVLMTLEGPIQDYVTLETTYLGILAHNLTMANDGKEVDLQEVENKARAVVEAAKGRPVLYMGARHYHMNQDAEIAAAAIRGGFTGTSTDVGSAVLGQRGVGTIPHVLENVMAHKYGMNRAVVEATKAFDKHMDKEIPRIALIDYNNCEITDAINTAREVPSLSAVRVDTCGENLAQGALRDAYGLKDLVGRDVDVLKEDEKYWFGNGVTVTGVYALRKGLDNAGFGNVGILLTSGFGNPEKVKAFTRAEQMLETKLFDGLGCGQLAPSRTTTMDVFEVEGNPISKVGRYERPNQRLERRL